MLVALSIRDIVLIDKLDLDFSGGLTVFTGETGAGKSIVLDSLGLALGFRGDTSLVRRGARSGSVSASFEIDAAHPLHENLREHGLDDGGAMIARRVQFADGRGKAFVNDRPVSTALLRELGRALVEIHGQHDDRALLDASSHRDLLDQFGGLEAEARAVLLRWRAWKDRILEAEKLEEELERAARERDYLEACVSEFERLAPKPGEEGALAEKRRALIATAKLREDLEGAAAALSERSFPAKELNSLCRRLERQSPLPDNIKPLMAAVERVLIEAEEARALIEAALRLEPDGDIEAIEARLFELRGLARKHRVAVDGLSDLHAKMAGELAMIKDGAARVEAAKKSVEEARRAYAAKAEELSVNRRSAAARLDRAVQKELAPLKLGTARFTTILEPIEGDAGPERGACGNETVSFQVQTNPGAKAGPLMKIASGGELARFLLALKVVLAEKHTAPVLVFDEIDAGIGGATAAAIGERLQALARKAQVIAVTHSPQVAAQASAHYRLYKSARGGAGNISVETRAEALDGSGRREEIARMLAGRSVTPEARAAAQRLMGGRHDAGAL